MLSVLAIIISLALLIYLGYKGWSIVLLAPILALLAAILTAIFTGGEFHVLATYTEVFMTNMAGLRATSHSSCSVLFSVL